MMITSWYRGERLAVWVVSLAVAIWAMNGSWALAKGSHGGGGHGGGHHGGGGHGGGHHGGGGHHAGGHHVGTHHAAGHGGDGHRAARRRTVAHQARAHRAMANHAVAHPAAVHRAVAQHAAGQAVVRGVAATQRVNRQGLVSRNVIANRAALGASATGGRVVNQAGYPNGNNRTGYGFGYGVGQGASGYGRRPWYGGYGNYGYGNAYPYTSSSYWYNTPIYGMSGTVARSVMADPATELLNSLGIAAQSVVDSTGPAVQVSAVYAGTPAERAGLVGGDLIRAANGYLTRSREELAQDVANTPTSGVLSLSVRSVGDVADHSVSVVVP